MVLSLGAKEIGPFQWKKTSVGAGAARCVCLLIKCKLQAVLCAWFSSSVAFVALCCLVCIFLLPFETNIGTVIKLSAGSTLSGIIRLEGIAVNSSFGKS